jgi:hypothetical protein
VVKNDHDPSSDSKRIPEAGGPAGAHSSGDPGKLLQPPIPPPVPPLDQLAWCVAFVTCRFNFNFQRISEANLK